MTISPLEKYVDKCTPRERRGNALSRSIQLRAGELHQLRVLLVLRAHQRVELLGGARSDPDAESGYLRVDLGRSHGRQDAGVQPGDELARRSRRHERTQ